MSRYREYLRSEAAYHILIWALLIIPHGFFSYPLLERFGATKYIANLLVTDGLMLVIVYLNVFYLIRRYYKARKFVTYYVILMMLIGIYIYAAIALESFIMPRTRSGQTIVSMIVSTSSTSPAIALLRFCCMISRKNWIRESNSHK